MKKLFLIPAVMVFAISAAFTVYGARPEQIVILYICQTERELEEILAWESRDPARYRQATKNGKVMPLDAAREAAGSKVAADWIRCDEKGNVEITRFEADGSGGDSRREVLDDAALARYCPSTITRYGHPCR